MDVREKLVELLQDENNPVWKWFPNNMETSIQIPCMCRSSHPHAR